MAAHCRFHTILYPISQVKYGHQLSKRNNLVANIWLGNGEEWCKRRKELSGPNKEFGFTNCWAPQTHFYKIMGPTIIKPLFFVGQMILSERDTLIFHNLLKEQ